MKLILEGKAKKIYSTPKRETLVQYFKDDTTAYNNKKKKKFSNKGVINNFISANIFSFLKINKIENHFIKRLSEREQLIKKVSIIPIEVVVRNIAAGSICKNLGIKIGKKISPPLIEFYLKSDDLNDPMLSEQHILYLNLCTHKELKKIIEIARKTNLLLIKYFKNIRIDLVDFKVEFGKYKKKIILADEISPDSCRLWDKKTNKSLDKDIFRESKGNLLDAYNIVFDRIKKKYYEL